MIAPMMALHHINGPENQNDNAISSAPVGGSVSLLLTGAIVDGGTPYGPVMLALVSGPVVVALIVAFTYPETARRELEELNPEDHTLPVTRDESDE